MASSIPLLHAVVWGARHPIGPSRPLATSRQPVHPSVCPYLSKSFLETYIALFSPVIGCTGISGLISTPGTPRSSISTIRLSAPLSNLHCVGDPFILFNLSPSHCWSAGSRLMASAQTFLTPWSVPTSVSDVTREWPSHTPFSHLSLELCVCHALPPAI